MSSSPTIAHLETLRADIRDEIKRRIEQRDKFSIQLTIALSVIVGVAFSQQGFGRALIAAPLVSIYFTVLILYSYEVHRVLARYLREEIEPALSSLCDTSPDLEWEGYYARHEVPGIRKQFFISALWAVLLVSLAYLFARESSDKGFLIVLTVVGSIYLVACVVVSWTFRH